VGIGVGVLGPVELSRDGVPIPLSGAPQRVLLARLALAAGRPVPVADLIDALWEGEPPENAVGNLHSYVSRLRRHTGGDALRREPGGYRLHLPADALDITRAERLVTRARGQRPEQAAVTLAEALAVWRGDPLADVAGRLVFAPEVARLAEWRRHLREQWLERRLDAGDAAAALPEVEALATSEPLRERTQLLLMRALHATGRTAEALTARIRGCGRRRSGKRRCGRPPVCAAGRTGSSGGAASWTRYATPSPPGGSPLWSALAGWARPA
jgi:DNA-binding SARP family transcriptional activator